MRPAHLHFLIYKQGYKTHISQVYLPDDPNIETDVQFGVTKALLGDYVRHENGTPPAPGVKDPWYTLDYTFMMEPGKAKLPRPPIQDKAKTTRDAAAVSAGGAARPRWRSKRWRSPRVNGKFVPRNRFRFEERFGELERSGTFCKNETPRRRLTPRADRAIALTENCPA